MLNLLRYFYNGDKQGFFSDNKSTFIAKTLIVSSSYTQQLQYVYVFTDKCRLRIGGTSRICIAELLGLSLQDDVCLYVFERSRKWA